MVVIRFGADQVGDISGIFVAAWLRDDQRSAESDGPEELPNRHVEAVRSLLQHTVASFERVLILHPENAIRNGFVGVYRSFGDARSIRKCK